jgi:hypothetical protein
MRFDQNMIVTDYNHIPRLEFFKELCKGKKVLHIGCIDWPFVPEHNLHIALQSVAARCDGFDLNSERYDLLKPFLAPEAKLFSLFSEIDEKYDLVLVPEVIEHVKEVGQFLTELDSLKASNYVFTAPCAVQCGVRGHFAYDHAGGIYTEIVHPEHLVWYSPYTLKNTLKTYTTWKVGSPFWLNGISVGVACQK